MGVESEAANVSTVGTKRGSKRGKSGVVEDQREGVEDANVAAAGTKRGSKRSKSSAVEDGKEEVPKKPSRPVEADPAEEQLIRDKIAAMPTIEEARRWEFPRLMTGFINFMRRLGFLSEVSIGIYLMNVKKLYFRDGKPPEVMVSEEYRQLVRASREDKMCSHQFSSALTKFTAFYEERTKAGRGRFTLDPVWEDEKTTKAAENKWRIDHPKPGELMSRWFQPQARPASRPAEAAPRPRRIDYTEVCGWVSIKDPTSQARIETPVRGKNCDHIGVFDRDAYVEYNGMLSKKQFSKLSNMWNCPLCNKPAPEATLQLDTVFAEALEIVRDRPDIEHLILQPDGRLCIPETTCVPSNKCADEEESTATPQKAPIAPSSPQSEPKQPSATRGTGCAGGSGNVKNAEMADVIQQEVCER